MKSVKRMITIVLATALILAMQSAGVFADSTSFTDVSESHWAYDNIAFMSAKGIVKGYPGGEFKPGGTVTYGEFIKMAVVAATGNDLAAASGNGTHWASGYYKAAVDAGMFTADQIAESSLNSVIPRKDMALIAANVLKADETANYEEMAKTFSDISGNPYEAQILESAKKGVINGYENGTFRPDNTLTRAESSAVITRLIAAINSAKGDSWEPGADAYVRTDNGKILGPSGNLLWQVPVDFYSETYCESAFIERTGHVYLVYREGGGVMGHDCQIRLMPNKATELDSNRVIFEYDGISFATGTYVPPGADNLFMKRDGESEWTKIGDPKLIYGWHFSVDTEGGHHGGVVAQMAYDGGEYLYVIGFEGLEMETAQAAQQKTGVYRVNINTNETVRVSPADKDISEFTFKDGEIVY